MKGLQRRGDFSSENRIARSAFKLRSKKVERFTFLLVPSNRRRLKKLYSYGSNQTLQVAGMFTTEVSVRESVLSGVEFVVIENEGHALLGRETAISLGVLKQGAHVNSLEVSTDGAKGEASIFEKFRGYCEGIGKLKDFQLIVPIDPQVQPVAQPIRRVPYRLRDKLSTKLDEHVKLDIIEKVSGPSS